MPKLKIGVIGCGAIGTMIALACEGRLRGRVALAGISDIDAAKTAKLNSSLLKKVPMLSLDKLISCSDLVVEAASAGVSAEVLRRCLSKRRDCLIMSVGGLLGHVDLLESAEKKGVSVFIPSGALCGIDGLKSAAIGKIDSVTLTTRKPLKGLDGAPYVRRMGIDLSSIKEEKVIFEGSAEEAVRGFPQNVNVSAVLSIAGIGAAKTRVRIVTAPGYTKNIHEVEITGEFGRITTRTENVPSVTNPKTSAMAFFSAIATLEGVTRSVKIGT